MPLVRRVYLDQAATSWPKLPAAVDASLSYVRDCGAATGRGAYASAQKADRWLADARLWLAKLLGADKPESIALCASGTHALNAALFGLLRPGQHVVTTAIEHNSVLRPLHQLRKLLDLRLSIVPCDRRGFVDPSDIERLTKTGAHALVVGHASNVTGAVQDLKVCGEIATRCGATFIVDASQTIGYIPIDVQDLKIDCLAAAGHKGLRALGGTGLLYVRDRLHANVQPLMFGGTGTASERIDVAPIWPASIEVGNLNLPGVVSMAAAAKYLCESFDSDWTTQWRQSHRKLVAALNEFSSVHVHGPGLDDPHIPVASLTVDDWDIHDLAAVFDSSFGIEVRSGLHCAALVHEHIGTSESGGTVRMSPGHDFPIASVDYVLDSLRSILAGQ